MQVLAIDPSTKSSGIAVFSNQELKHYECITSSSTNLFKRINVMITSIEKIIKEYNIDTIVMEEVLMDDVHNNNTVFKALIYLQAYIVGKLDEYHLTPKFYTSSQWRKKCGIHTGRGIRRESLKPADIKFVKDQFGIAVNDDIADAICIGFAEVGGDIKIPQTIIEDDGFEFA